eukprot:jgi/Hompol1/3899/HPOL_001660-RA
MRRPNMKFSLTALNSALVAYSKLNNVKHVRHLFKEITDQASLPTSRTLGAIIDMAWRDRRSMIPLVELDEILEYYQLFAQQTDRKEICTTMLSKLASIFSLHRSNDKHLKLPRFELILNQHTERWGSCEETSLLVPLINTYMQLNDLAKVDELFNKHPSQKFTSVAMLLARTYMKHGLLNRAEEILETAQNNGLPITTELINVKLQIAEASRDDTKVERLFNEMSQHGCVPDWLTFLTVCRAMLNMGAPEKSLHYATIMTEQYNILPERDMIAIIVSSHGMLGNNVEHIHKLFDQMFERGSIVMPEVFTATVRYYGSEPTLLNKLNGIVAQRSNLQQSLRLERVRHAPVEQ